MQLSIIYSFNLFNLIAAVQGHGETSRIRASSTAICTGLASGAVPTVTTAFAPALLPHVRDDDESDTDDDNSGNPHDDHYECPQSAALNVHYHLDQKGDGLACCTQSFVLTMASGNTPACCPCGAACTAPAGVPSVVDWAFTTGAFSGLSFGFNLLYHHSTSIST